MHKIIPAVADSDVAAVRRLFSVYAASFPVDLTMQDIDGGKVWLPGIYSPPYGALFLARSHGTAAGCIGLRPFSRAIGELKCLYVLPHFRGRGIARALVSAAIAEAGRIGYHELMLDLLDSMQSVVSLCKTFGFERAEPFWPNPFPQAQYFRLLLDSRPQPKEFA